MHQGHRERLKTRFFKEGLAGFAPHEVLELLLTFAIPQRDVNPLAHELIAHFGTFFAVLEASPEELQRVKGIGRNASALLSMIPQLVGFYERNRLREKPMLRNLRQSGEYCKSLFHGSKNELFYLICLDAQGRLIHPALLYSGTIDEAQIYPRNIVETALRYNAHAVVLTHNHPGGGLLPSYGDYDATRMIIEALSVIEIKVVDHIIVADGLIVSMAKFAMLEKGRLIDEDDFTYRISSAAKMDRKNYAVGESTLEEYDVFKIKGE